MQKSLIIIGIFFIIAGLLWPYFGKIPFGRLPGDILISRPGMKLYIPLGTMTVASIVISIILWIFRK